MRKDNSQQRILDVAQLYLQQEGYSGVRYQTIAERLGITRASVHYYFPQKDDLIGSVLDQYIEATTLRLQAIDTDAGATSVLQEYVQVYREVLGGRALLHCPGGIMAADISNLPSTLADRVHTFFSCHIQWVDENLSSRAGSNSQTMSSQGIVAFLQGALLITRIRGTLDVFDALADNLIDSWVEDSPTRG